MATGRIAGRAIMTAGIADVVDVIGRDAVDATVTVIGAEEIDRGDLNVRRRLNHRSPAARLRRRRVVQKIFLTAVRTDWPNQCLAQAAPRLLSRLSERCLIAPMASRNQNLKRHAIADRSR